MHSWVFCPVPAFFVYMSSIQRFSFHFTCKSVWIRDFLKTPTENRISNTRRMLRNQMIILAQFDVGCWYCVCMGRCLQPPNPNTQSDIANLSIIPSICYANIHIEFLSFRIPLYIYVPCLHFYFLLNGK